MKRIKTRNAKTHHWEPLLLLSAVVILIDATAFHIAYRYSDPGTVSASRAVELSIFAAAEGAETTFAINTSLLKEYLAGLE